MSEELTPKQFLWCEHYLQTWNATRSAKLAGYRGNYNTLGVVGHENLKKPKIKAYLEKRLSEITLKADEVLTRLSQQATASIADFIKPVGNLFMIDIDKIVERGHLVKKIKQNPKTGIEIELYDAQSALVHLGKHYALFTEKVILAWEKEAEEAGIPASVLFEQMVAEIMKELQEQHAGN